MNRRASAVKAGCAVVALVAIAGCQSLEDCAKETFSKEFTCPQERVTARERKDVDAYSAIFGAGAKPSDEVKADPGRYALWKKEQSDNREKWNGMMTIFEAKGCDHTSLYACNHPNSTTQNNSAPSANCSKVTLEADAAH